MARAFSPTSTTTTGISTHFLAASSLRLPALVFCRGVPRSQAEKYARGSVHFPEEPMAVSRLLPQADLVICHASHQMTAQALLAGKPVLLLPTQLEQFLIMRRVVRYGARVWVPCQNDERRLRRRARGAQGQLQIRRQGARVRESLRRPRSQRRASNDDCALRVESGASPAGVARCFPAKASPSIPGLRVVRLERGCGLARMASMAESVKLPEGKEPVLRVVPMPADANQHGDIFGGWIMAQVDIAGGVRRRAAPAAASPPWR